MNDSVGGGAWIGRRRELNALSKRYTYTNSLNRVVGPFKIAGDHRRCVCSQNPTIYDYYRSFNQLLHASFGDLNSVSSGLFANRKWIYKIGTKRIGSNAFLMILCFDSHYFMMVYTSQRSIMMVVNGLNMWVLSSSHLSGGVCRSMNIFWCHCLLCIGSLRFIGLLSVENIRNLHSHSTRTKMKLKYYWHHPFVDTQRPLNLSWLLIWNKKRVISL